MLLAADDVLGESGYTAIVVTSEPRALNDVAVGGGGEVVLTLAIASDTEVLVMDGSGIPLESLRSVDAVPVGPSILTRAG